MLRPGGHHSGQLLLPILVSLSSPVNIRSRERLVNLDLILGTDQTSPLLWTPKKKEEVHAIIGAMLKQGTGDRAAVHEQILSLAQSLERSKTWNLVTLADTDMSRRSII